MQLALAERSKGTESLQKTCEPSSTRQETAPSGSPVPVQPAARGWALGSLLASLFYLHSRLHPKVILDEATHLSRWPGSSMRVQLREDPALTALSPHPKALLVGPAHDADETMTASTHAERTRHSSPRCAPKTAMPFHGQGLAEL